MFSYPLNKEKALLFAMLFLYDPHRFITFGELIDKLKIALFYRTAFGVLFKLDGKAKQLI